MATDTLMTTEELLSMPDDGVERWLIRGQLREQPMTKRSRSHSRVMSRISHLLEGWLEKQPEPTGEVLSGEAGCRLQRDPDTSVGIDVVYFSAEVVSKNTDESKIVEGVPTLVIEILSPSDTQERIHEKIDTYLEVGVPLVWMVDPHDRTVSVYRPGAEPELFNSNQSISAEPHLPGFSTPVAKMFSI